MLAGLSACAQGPDVIAFLCLPFGIVGGAIYGAVAATSREPRAPYDPAYDPYLAPEPSMTDHEIAAAQRQMAALERHPEGMPKPFVSQDGQTLCVPETTKLGDVVRTRRSGLEGKVTKIYGRAGVCAVSSPIFVHMEYLRRTTFERRAQSEPNLHKVGKIDNGDVFPAGDLYANYDVNYTDSDNDLRTWFVVKFRSPSTNGARSYAASMKIKCSTGVFSVVQSMTSATEHGMHPPIVASESYSPPLVVDKPSSQLASAVREICNQSPWDGS